MGTKSIFLLIETPQKQIFYHLMSQKIYKNRESYINNCLSYFLVRNFFKKDRALYIFLKNVFNQRENETLIFNNSYIILKLEYSRFPSPVGCNFEDVAVFVIPCHTSSLPFTSPSPLRSGPDYKVGG